jgi:hypothetical protein
MILSNSRRSQRRRYKTAGTDSRYRPQKNDFAVNDFAKPFHHFGVYRDAATGTTALGTRTAPGHLFHSFCSPSFCQKIPFPPFLFEHFSDTRI